MLRLIIAMKVFGHNSVESFRRELSRNSQLRKACGLNDYDNRYGKIKLLPDTRVFSSFFKRLMFHQSLLEEIFADQVDWCYSNRSDFGKTLAGDGKYINSYARKRNNGNDLDQRIECDAEYSKKNYNYATPTGEKKAKTTNYFGSKVHAIVDVNTELPININVEKSNKSENTVMKR